MQFRRTRCADIAACVALIDERFLYADEELREVERLCLELLRAGTAYSSVVTDERFSFPVAFGIAGFVDDELADAYQRFQRSSISRDLFDRWRDGRSAFLSERDIARANAGPGVNCVVIAAGWKPTDVETRELASMKLTEGFMDVHLGIRFRSFAHQLFGEPPLTPKALGVSEVRSEEIRLARESMLITAHRDSYVGENFLATQLFTKVEAPKIGFDARSREVLKFAMDGLSDDEIADEVGITLQGVKKRWRQIFAIVRAASPTLLGERSIADDDGKRGAESRSVVLQYVRSNRAELHPYDFGATLLA
jgi:DNA-binding CsgD family transcriptional regulator